MKKVEYSLIARDKLKNLRKDLTVRFGTEVSILHHRKHLIIGENDYFRKLKMVKIEKGMFCFGRMFLFLYKKEKKKIMRKEDDDSGGESARVQTGVWVNFFGTLICDVPLPLETDNVLWLQEGDFVWN